MEFDEVVDERNSYRSLAPLEITDGMIEELMTSAVRSPSNSNAQDWRLVFIREPEQLGRIFDTLTGGNYWARKASMMIAIAAEGELKCEPHEAPYPIYNAGLISSFIFLKATEMGLVTHPMAGFDKEEAGRVIGLPEGHTLIALVAVGGRSEDMSGLSGKHREQELERSTRLPLNQVVFFERFPARK